MNSKELKIFLKKKEEENIKTIRGVIKKRKWKDVREMIEWDALNVLKQRFADEVIVRAKLDPYKKPKDLTDEEITRMLKTFFGKWDKKR